MSGKEIVVSYSRAYQQIDRPSEALRFLTIALEGESAAVRTVIRQRITALNEEISRRARNAARQPHISEAVDQPQLVRPRILPRTVVQGGAQ